MIYPFLGSSIPFYGVFLVIKVDSILLNFLFSWVMVNNDLSNSSTTFFSQLFYVADCNLLVVIFI